MSRPISAMLHDIFTDPADPARRKQAERDLLYLQGLTQEPNIRAAIAHLQNALKPTPQGAQGGENVRAD